MIDQIGNNSVQEGRLRSRLPTLNEEWIVRIRGSADFFGLNYYTSRYIEEPSLPEGPNPSFERDRFYRRLESTEWTKGGSEWLYLVPQGLRDMLRCVCNLELSNVKFMQNKFGFSVGLKINTITQ